MRPFWLATRSRIGMKIFTLINSKAVMRSCLCRSETGKISAGLRGQGMKGTPASFIRRSFQDEVQASCFRRPNPEMRPPVSGLFRTEGEAPGNS